jgi:hypothetical protein
LGFYDCSSLKQQPTDRLVAPLKQQPTDRLVAPLERIILIPSQSAFVLTPYFSVFNGNVANAIFIVLA